MNDTVTVQKDTLDHLLNTLNEAKAKLSLLSAVSLDSFSKDASYGLFLVATNISDNLESIEHTILDVRDRTNNDSTKK